MRKFDTGATRDSADSKPDFQGFLSPFAMARFAQYMQKHQRQADGTLRDSDNWKKGIPMVAYEKSLYRHMMEFFIKIEESDFYGADEVLQAIIFNANGWSHERHKPHGADPISIVDSQIVYSGGLNAEPLAGVQPDVAGPQGVYPATQYGDRDDDGVAPDPNYGQYLYK